MGKKLKTKAKKKKVERKPQKNFFTEHPNWTAVILLFLLLIIFYYPIVFENKTLLPPDKLTAQSYENFFNKAIEDGTYPLWNPYIFSGMPSYGSLASARLVNVFDAAINYTILGIRKIIPMTSFMRILLNYLFFGLLVYLLLKSFKLNRYACLFSAIAVMFIPQYIAFTAFGHNTKFLSLVLIPLIFWSVDQLIKKQNLLFFTITALALGFQLLRAHVQVCYYTYLLIGIYVIYYAVIEFRETNKFDKIAKTLGLILGAGIVALLLSSVMYLSVYEYSHYSIRGGGETGGLNYDYASSWSFSPYEMVTFFVPSFFGFGGATYWGKMPFTDYPLYMGIVVLFLAGLAFVLKRDRKVIFFGIVALFALIVSFGKHLPILYSPMFEFLPFFNKFRVPSMIHILLDFSVVILAGFGLHYLIQLKETNDKNLIDRKSNAVRIYFYVFGSIEIALLLLITLGKSVLFNWMGSAARPLNSGAQQMAHKMALQDSVVMLILVGITGFLVLYYLSGKLKANLLGFSLMALLIVDLWIVDFKIIDPKPQVSEEAFFKKTDVVDFLEKQDPQFRIFPLKINQPGEKPDNWWMYFLLQNIYGYHAAKLKIYQEAMDELSFPQTYLFKYLKQGVDEQGKRTVTMKKMSEVQPDLLYGHQTFLNMLNCKYLISSYPIPDTSYQLVYRGSQLVYENKHALPRAFFVNDIVVKDSKQDIFNLIKSGRFNPAQTAILEKEPEFPVVYYPENTVDLVSFDIHHIKLKASVKTPALMLLSEIYYPVGWNAYVDGKTTEIYKTNYILRSIFLKPGEHEIDFRYEQASFKWGAMLSAITLILLILAFIFSYRKMIRSNEQTEK